jgi:crotonobetainyl-CoA:carnitine CoA-transferase CaiB-like acyl-CoA transferase
VKVPVPRCGKVVEAESGVSLEDGDAGDEADGDGVAVVVVGTGLAVVIGVLAAMWPVAR